MSGDRALASSVVICSAVRSACAVPVRWSAAVRDRGQHGQRDQAGGGELQHRAPAAGAGRAAGRVGRGGRLDGARRRAGAAAGRGARRGGWSSSGGDGERRRVGDAGRPRASASSTGAGRPDRGRRPARRGCAAGGRRPSRSAWCSAQASYAVSAPAVAEQAQGGHEQDAVRLRGRVAGEDQPAERDGRGASRAASAAPDAASASWPCRAR